MKIRIAVVDNLYEDRSSLRNRINRWLEKSGRISAGNYEIHCFNSAEEMLEAFSPGFYQLAFLDIRVEGADGITLARRLRRSDPRLLIIFITTSREYMDEAFQVHSFDYLIQPFSAERIGSVLEDAFRYLNAPEPEIQVRVAHNTCNVPLAQIISVISSGHSVELYLKNGHCLRSIMTFSEIRRLLTEDPRFLFCNRGILINMDHVESLDQGSFRMKEGPSCPLRVRRRSQIVSEFSRYRVKDKTGDGSLSCYPVLL